MNSLKELREAIRAEINPEKRSWMGFISDGLSASISVFNDYPTAENLTTLNGWWIQGHKAYESRTPLPDPTSPAAGGEIQERKAA